MKRFLTILTALLILSGTAITAQEQGDEYDDGFVYKNNGAGDNFLKFGLGAIFPLIQRPFVQLLHEHQRQFVFHR